MFRFFSWFGVNLPFVDNFSSYQTTLSKPSDIALKRLLGILFNKKN